MFEPEFNHQESIRKSLGITRTDFEQIQVFISRKASQPISYKWATEIMEDYWKKIPENLKSEPFYTFLIGMMIQQILNKPFNNIHRN